VTVTITPKFGDSVEIQKIYGNLGIMVTVTEIPKFRIITP